MSHIFISYSHKDKEYVHRLQDALLNEGFEVWIDDRIDYGDEWPMVIQESLDGCDAFVLVATENSYKSKWVQKEVTRAQRINKPFFPLLLSGSPWLSIESTQYVDVRDKSLPPERFYERLASVTPRGLHTDGTDELEKLKSQAIRFELSGKLYDALQAYYKIKRIDPLFPGIDDKIKQLERETRPKPFPRVQPIQGAIIMFVFLIFIVVSFLIERNIVTTLPLPSSTFSPTSFRTLSPSASILAKTSILTLIPQPTKTSIPPTPTLSIGSTMISLKDSMTLMYVPAGNFMMGSNSGNANEQPVHTVYLDAFWIDQTNVTNKMYALCVNVGFCEHPTNKSSNTRSSYYGNLQYDNYPVIWVDWNMAKTYCEWAGRRLPTEAEWEKAARGTDGRFFPWGNNPLNNTLLNVGGFVGDTTKVGAYPNGASPYGVFDMAGNVFQWVADWYSDTYYTSLPASNPLGPNSGNVRVVRGSAYFSNYFVVSTTTRSWRAPADPNDGIGFRCAMSAGK